MRNVQRINAIHQLLNALKQQLKIVLNVNQLPILAQNVLKIIYYHRINFFVKKNVNGTNVKF